MGSENAATGAVPGAGTGSENKAAARRGRQPTHLPLTYAAVLEEYANSLARADLTAQARRTYLSRVRMYLSWLADTHVDGDPLNDPAAAAWAARDYKSHLYGAQKRAPATVNAALAAVSDLAIRRGLGALDADLVARLELPQRRAPKALTGRDDTRWQRAAQAAPPRDRALAAGTSAPVIVTDGLRLVREVLTETKVTCEASAAMADIDWARARMFCSPMPPRML